MNTTSPTTPRMIWLTVLVASLLYVACSDADSGGGSTSGNEDKTSGTQDNTPPTLTAGDITYASIAEGTADISKPTSETLTDLSGLTFSLAPINTYNGDEVQERPTIVEDGTITTTATTTANSYRVTITPDGSTILGEPITADFYVTANPADIKELDRMLEQAITDYGLTGDFNYIDTSAVTTMAFLFRIKYAAGVILVTDTDRTYMKDFQGNISKWNVSAVENFSYMFADTPVFNQDISEWNMAKGKTFEGMFFNAPAFNQDISKWNVSAGENFAGMFGRATAFNQNVGGWDVSAGTNFGAMFFKAAAFNQDLSRWKVDPTDNITNIFKNSGVTTLPSWYQ